MVVMQGGDLVRRFSVVVCAATLAVLHAVSGRWRIILIHLFLVYLLLFPQCGCIVIEDSCGGVVENYRPAHIIGSVIRYVTTLLALQATDCFGLYTYLSGSC